MNIKHGKRTRIHWDKHIDHHVDQTNQNVIFQDQAENYIHGC